MARSSVQPITPGKASDVSALLRAWGCGDLVARDRLMLVVYDELRRRARAYMRREQVGHTLQPAALVHEACGRLANQDRVAWETRAHVYGVTAALVLRI